MIKRFGPPARPVPPRHSDPAASPKVRQALAQVRTSLIREGLQRLKLPERWLRLAVNEAESIAWQTRYPHLVFPGLAAEKLAGLAAWHRRQQSVRQASESAMAA